MQLYALAIFFFPLVGIFILPKVCIFNQDIRDSPTQLHQHSQSSQNWNSFDYGKGVAGMERHLKMAKSGVDGEVSL